MGDSRDQQRTGEAAGATVGTTADIAVAHIFFLLLGLPLGG